MKALNIPRARIGGDEDPDVVKIRRKVLGGEPSGVAGSLWRKDHLFSSWFDPMGIEKFLSDYLGKKSYHGATNLAASSKYADFYTLEKFKELLISRAIPEPYVVMYDSKQMALKGKIKAHGVLEPQEIIKEMYLNRASMVVNNLDFCARGVAELMEALSDWTGSLINVNSYFTLRGGQTFKWHWDNHDTLIIQTHGQKEWSIFEAQIHQPMLSHDGSMWPEFNEKTSQLKERFILKKGEFIYIPGGHPHYAKALDTHDSLHVTFGLATTTWHDVVSHIVRNALRETESEIGFRESLDFSNPSELRTSKRETVQKKMDAFIQKIDLDCSDMAPIKPPFHKPMSIQNLSLLWDSMSELESINDESKIVRLVKLYLRDTPEAIELVTSSEKYFFPKVLRNPLEFIQNNKSFKVSDLVSLSSPEERVRVVRFFIEAGLVACSR